MAERWSILCKVLGGRSHSREGAFCIWPEGPPGKHSGSSWVPGKMLCPLACLWVWACLSRNRAWSFPGSALRHRAALTSSWVSWALSGFHQWETQAGDLRVGRKEEPRHFSPFFSDSGMSLTALDILVASVSPGNPP